MNIRFPKAQNFITALLEVGIARFVSLDICRLDGIQIAAVNGRVGVPEVPVPLNDEHTRGNEHIHDKLAADDLLLQVVNPEAVKNSGSCTLESVRSRFVRKAKNSSYALLLCRSISASVRAMIPVTLPYKIATNIERFPAGRALSYFSIPSLVKCALPCLLFGLWCSLPGIGAIQRTEANSAPRCASILKHCPAPLAGAHIARVAPFCAVRLRYKWLAAFLAELHISNVFSSHITIIPWRIGDVKCN